jgi:protein tyrosine phosphatase
MADGNFLGLFRYSEIGETGITLGTYPSGHQDIQTIAESGAKAVLCVMTHDDFKQRGIDWNNLQNQYRQKGIEPYHEPINDDQTPQYADGLFKGAVRLNQLKKQYKDDEIFVHCTAGVSRGPTLMIVYMALFIKDRRWRSVEDLYDYLEDIYRW